MFCSKQTNNMINKLHERALRTVLNDHISDFEKPLQKSQKQPPEVFFKRWVLKTFVKFKWKYLCQSLFFNKVAGFGPATLLKKRLWHRCFPVNFAKFLETPFLLNNSGGYFCLLVQKLQVLGFDKLASLGTCKIKFTKMFNNEGWCH